MNATSSRPPPSQPPPPSYAFVTRVYKRNLRPIVIATAFLSGLWALFSGIGWFRSSSIEHKLPHIANLALALGVLYMSVFGISLFGIYGAVSQRALLVRIYTLLAAFAAFIVAAAGMTRIVTHFVWKNDIIAECTTLTTGGQIIYYGFWGPIQAGTLTPAEAAAWCHRAWDRDSWSDIVALLILLLLAALFTTLIFAYHRQLQDPTSAANATRAPFAGGAPAHYNPPYAPSPYGANNDRNRTANADYSTLSNGYDTSMPTLAYGYGAHDHDEAFVPPNEGKPPGYSGAGAARKGGGDVDGKGEDPFADFEGGSTK